MLRKEQGNAFISKAREWVRKTSDKESINERKQVENAYDYYKELV